MIAPLISEEDLSGILHIGLASTYIAKEMARRVHAAIPEANIVIFIRSQFSAAFSWYNQYLRQGGTSSLKKYLFPDEYIHTGMATSFKTARFHFAQLDYKGLIEQYDSLYGRDQVHVFTYEEFVRDRSATIDRMRELLGIELPECQLPHGSSSNESYRRGLRGLARGLNLFTARAVSQKRTLIHIPHWYVVRRKGLDWLNKVALFGKRPNFERDMDKSIRMHIADTFGASNCWLSQRLGADLGALGYPVASPPAGPRQSIRPALWRWTRR